MTRDTWLRRCAQQFMDKAGVDTGEAAAYASACAADQARAQGIRPLDWDKPEAAADAEMQGWEESA